MKEINDNTRYIDPIGNVVVMTGLCETEDFVLTQVLEACPRQQPIFTNGDDVFYRRNELKKQKQYNHAFCIMFSVDSDADCSDEKDESYPSKSEIFSALEKRINDLKNDPYEIYEAIGAPSDTYLHYEDNEESPDVKTMDNHMVRSLCVRVGSRKLLDEIESTVECSTRDGCAEAILDTAILDDTDVMKALQNILPGQPLVTWARYDNIHFYI